MQQEAYPSTTLSQFQQCQGSGHALKHPGAVSRIQQGAKVQVVFKILGQLEMGLLKAVGVRLRSQ